MGRDHLRLSARAIIAAIACALSISSAQALSPKHFVVFFGYGKCELTDEARRVIAEYFEATRQIFDGYGYGTVLDAHADTAEDAAGLSTSQCRGEAVARALMEMGYQREKIRICDKGARELTVQTARATKEPQNRRVHIDPMDMDQLTRSNCAFPSPPSAQ